MLDPANWENVINMVSKYATGIPKNVLWYSIYGLVPSDSSDPVRFRDHADYSEPCIDPVVKVML